MSAPTSPSRVNPDVEDILKHIDGLKRLRRTRRMSEKIARLERQAANLSAPVHRLPMECLCEIFVQAARIDHKAPITLSQVSKTWRRVALNYPPLWSQIKMYCKKKSRCEKRLKYWLEKSGQSTLDLDVVVEDGADASHAALVQEHIHRCRRLVFWNHSPDRIDIITGWPPRLKYLDLAGFKVESIDTVLSLLKGCRELRLLGLRYLQITSTSREGGRKWPSNHEVVSLPQLHDLILPQWSPDLINALIPHIHTPRLMTLDISAHSCDPSGATILQLQPTPGSWSSVRVLRTRGCAFLDNVMMEFVQLVPNLEILFLRTVWITDNFLKTLAHPDPKGGWYAPRLRQLHFHAVHQIGSDALKELIDVRAPHKDSTSLTTKTYLQAISVNFCQKVGPDLAAWLKAQDDRFECRVSSQDSRTSPYQVPVAPTSSAQGITVAQVITLQDS